jgi:KDO2-lipid IV(A) lauroyltransferase
MSGEKPGLFKRFRQRIEYWLLLAVLQWAERGGWRKIPSRAEVIGTILYLILGLRRKIAIDNIHRALGYALPKCKRLARGSFRSIVITALEMAQMDSVSPQWIGERLTFSQTEPFAQIARMKRGGLLVTAHFGNWELIGALVGRKGLGYPVSVVVQEQSNPMVEELMLRLREGYGFKVIPRGRAGQETVRALHRGEMVAMLADQAAGAEGELYPLFGRPASTYLGPALIASRLGTPIIFGFCVRNRDNTYSAHIEPPVILNQERDKAVAQYLRLYTRLIEEYAGRYPEQYLWLHRRWKRK